MAIEFSLRAPGAMHAWLGGAVRGLLTVTIDGRQSAAVRHVLNNDGGYIDAGTRWLSAGRHVVTIAYKQGGWHPGSGGGGLPRVALGPFILTRANETRSVAYVPASSWRTLCGRSLDWIEAFRQH
jgi:hypothetical protein